MATWIGIGIVLFLTASVVTAFNLLKNVKVPERKSAKNSDNEKK